MYILVVIFLVLCAWHYFAQAILIPNQAHDSKYKLYAERDELRRLYIVGEITPTEFNHLDKFASNAIKLYRNVSLFDLIFFKIGSRIFKNRFIHTNRV